MFKIMKKVTPNYLLNLIPKCEKIIRTRNNQIPTYKYRTDCSKYFFPSTLNDWLNLDVNIRNSVSISIFKSRLLFDQFKAIFTIFLIRKELTTR